MENVLGEITLFPSGGMFEIKLFPLGGMFDVQCPTKRCVLSKLKCMDVALAVVEM